MLELKSLWLSSVSFGIDFDWNRFYIGRTTTCRSFSLSWVDERNWTLDAGCTTFFIPQLCVFRNISLWGFFHLAVLSRFLHSPVLILLFLNILLARVCWNCTRHQLSTTFYFIFFFSTSFLLNSFKNIRLLVSYQTIDPLPPPHLPFVQTFPLHLFFSSSFLFVDQTWDYIQKTRQPNSVVAGLRDTSFPSSFQMTIYVLNVANSLF